MPTKILLIAGEIANIAYNQESEKIIRLKPDNYGKLWHTKQNMLYCDSTESGVSFIIIDWTSLQLKPQAVSQLLQSLQETFHPNVERMEFLEPEN